MLFFFVSPTLLATTISIVVDVSKRYRGISSGCPWIVVPGTLLLVNQRNLVNSSDSANDVATRLMCFYSRFLIDRSRLTGALLSAAVFLLLRHQSHFCRPKFQHWFLIVIIQVDGSWFVR